MIIMRKKTLIDLVERTAIAAVYAHTKAILDQNDQHLQTVRQANRFAVDEARAIKVARVLSGFKEWDANATIDVLEKKAGLGRQAEAKQSPE